MRLFRRAFLKGLLRTALAGLLSAFWAFAVEPMWRLRVQRWRVVTGSGGSSILSALLGMRPGITVLEPG